MTPVLISDQMLVEVTVDPPAGEKDAAGVPKWVSPFPPFTVTVVPFTRAEGRVYEQKRKELAPTPDEWERHQVKVFERHIKGWSLQLVPGTPAQVNAGTIERMPWFAFDKIEDALFLSAGKLVGNSAACSGS